MQSDFPHPLTPAALGILDLTVTLLPPAVAAVPDYAPLPLGIELPPLPLLLLADRLAELYEMVFPDRPEWLAERVQWQDEEDVAEAVGRFLQRVGALFPVHDDFWDTDLDVVEWRLYEIPVVPMGIDEWYDSWDDLPEPLPYLLHAAYSRGSEGSPAEFAALYPAHGLPRYLEPYRLVDALRGMGLPEPLDALPDLILMAEHATGNPWLDVGEIAMAEGGGYPQWRPETVASLHAAWLAAEPVLEGVERLLDWQKGTPEELARKLTAVRDALLAAYRQVQNMAETAVSPEVNDG